MIFVWPRFAERVIRKIEKKSRVYDGLGMIKSIVLLDPFVY